MVVTENLERKFDESREISAERLDVLKSLGIDPKFAAKCEEMFAEIKAGVDEVVAVKSDLIKENKEITGNNKIKLEIQSAANNSDYNSNRNHRKIA